MVGTSPSCALAGAQTCASYGDLFSFITNSIKKLAQVFRGLRGSLVPTMYAVSRLQEPVFERSQIAILLVYNSMSRKYKIRDQNKLYFVTFTVIQWLDIFIRREYKDILLESLRYCQKHKGLEVYAYCIMTSHAHLIIGRHGDRALEGLIGDIKKYTANKLIEAIRDNPQESRRDLLMWLFERAGKANSNNTNYQFWQQHSHPIELSTNEILDQRLHYVHNNPVEAGIVLSPEHYLYSSALNYAGLPEKLLEVILI